MSTEQPYEERGLLVQMAAGSEIAFGQIYKRYADQIYSVAYMYCKDEDQAKDAVQVTFMKVWERRQQLADMEKFSGWLFIIARNFILGQLRRNVASDNYIEYIKKSVYTVDEDPNELALLQKQQSELLQNALAALPERQRTAILLRRNEALSYAEIAVRMGISENTVRVHLYKGMETLRSRLVETGELGGIFFLLFLLSR